LTIVNPDIKIIFYNIVKEFRIKDNSFETSIEALLLKAINLMQPQKDRDSKNPSWVLKIKDVLYANFSEPFSLNELSKELDIHPVHLSRDFSKYFYCSLGDYIRKIKIEKSLSLFDNKNLSLTHIAYQCGFSDQSHFTRCFKALNGLTPLVYRKIVVAC
jgi:AraC-like DNA-binding protein